VDPNSEKELKILAADEEIKVGTCIKFRITNEGINPAYVSLLDIQPDNVHLGYKAEEYYVEPGESITTNFIIEIGKPLGEETLLLLSSKNPLDLAGIVSNNGHTKKGFNQLSSFEQQFSNSFETKRKKGMPSRRQQKEKLSSKTIFFKIVPR